MSRLTNSTSDIIDGKAKQIDMIKEQQIYLKLKTLEDLEDELGCPLVVIFKAFKEGIYFNFNRTCKEEFIEPIDLSLRYSLGGFYCLYFEQWNDGYEVDLSNYQKTWWLKGEVDLDEK